VLLKPEPDEDDRVRLTVQDAEVGLDLPSAEKVFEASYTTKNAGMGIGWSVSRFIIESHGGRIWAGGLREESSIRGGWYGPQQKPIPKYDREPPSSGAFSYHGDCLGRIGMETPQVHAG